MSTCLVLLALLTSANSYVVNSNLDDGSAGTFRAAIDSAEANPGADTITFSIANATIALQTRLDTIFETVFIDGTTAPGYVADPRVLLSGELLAAANGIIFKGENASGSHVRGLSIGNFSLHGIAFFSTSDIQVSACHLGLNNDGVSAVSIGNEGIALRNVSNAYIGGDLGIDRNIFGYCNIGISATTGCSDIVINQNIIGLDHTGELAAQNISHGIYIQGVDSFQVSNVTAGYNQGSGLFVQDAKGGWVLNNLFGLNLSANAARPNNINGMHISGGSGHRVTNNYFSGNSGTGLFIDNQAYNLQINNNIMGLNYTGTQALPNGNFGICLQNVRLINVTHNTVSGNSQEGIMIRSSCDSVGVWFNYVGTGMAGTGDFGNGIEGIEVDNSDYITVNNNIVAYNNRGILFITGSEHGTIAGNSVGVDITGNTAAPNSSEGISIENASDSVYILSNTISGNTTHGVAIRNSSYFRLEDNIIGLNEDGTGAIPNIQYGILIENNSSYGSVGGYWGYQGNIISGNDQHGIFIANDCIGNTIQSNIIGMDAAQNQDFGNAGHGILIQARNDSTFIADNVIGFNTASGIYAQSDCDDITIENNFIGTNEAGNLFAGNGQNGIEVFSQCDRTIIDGNVISNNADMGIYLHQDCDEAEIYNNYVGLDVSGTVAMGNGNHGIHLLVRCRDAIIGAEGQGNVVSDNGGKGIWLQQQSDRGIIQANYIGTDFRGRNAHGNSHEGIAINDVDDTQIGGNSLEGNIIADNKFTGLYVNQSLNGKIQGNTIGMDKYGKQALGNNVTGILFDNSDGWMIGGKDGLRNYIGNNANSGISLATGSTNDTILGNWIGLSKDGYTLMGNGTAAGHGIEVFSGQFITIGSSTAGEGNVIVDAPNGNGIYTEQTTSLYIRGNYIGTDSTLQLVGGNGLSGIALHTSSSSARIGNGLDNESGNTIMYNESYGVFLENSNVNQVQVNRNFMSSNTLRGIDLNTGANQSRGAPVISAMTNCEISGTTPVANDTIDIYYDFGYGGDYQGAAYIGRTIAVGNNWTYSGDISGAFNVVVQGTSGAQQSSQFAAFGPQDLVSAGGDTTIQICATDTFVNLFDVLLGNKDIGGTWTDDDASGGLTDSIFNPSIAGAGTFEFTYSIALTGSCAGQTESATITVDVNSQVYAGSGGNVIACADELEEDLTYTLNDGTFSSGTWIDVDNSEALVDGLFLPYGLSGSYTVWFIADSIGCQPDTAIIEVSIIDEANAGTMGFDTVCQGDLVNLFEVLDASGDRIGNWIDVNLTGQLSDSLVNTDNLDAGTYRFTYEIGTSGSCQYDTATAFVTILDLPAAGDGSQWLTCQNTAFIQLSDSLDANATSDGTWDSEFIDAAIFTDSLSLLDLATIDSTYTLWYIVNSEACGSDSATFQLRVVPAANAGSDSSFTICSLGDSLELITALNRKDLTGSFTSSSLTGLENGWLNPNVQPLGEHIFYYVVDEPDICGPDTAEFTVFISAPSSANLLLDSSVNLCRSELSLEVSTFYDGNGIWKDSVGNKLVNTEIDLTTWPTGGRIQYLLNDSVVCTADTAWVQIDLTDTLPTVSDTALLVSTQDEAFQVDEIWEPAIDADNWIYQPNSNAWNGLTFYPDSALTTIEYLIGYERSNVCGTDTGWISIYVESPCLENDTLMASTICYTEDTLDLNSFLPPNWSGTGGWASTSSDQINDSLLNLNTSNYQLIYLSDSINECGSDSLTLGLTIQPLPVADVIDDSAVCQSSELFDLTQLGASGADGSWILNGTVISDSLISTTEAGANAVAWTVNNACGSDTTFATLLVHPSPIVDAGPDQTLVRSTSTLLQGTTKGDSLHYWFPSTNLSDSTDLQSVAQPTETTTYTLVAINEYTCKNSDEIQITVDNSLEIPEAFTPDGDGSNDTWELRNIDLYPDYQLYVYDRWGDLIFESSASRPIWDGSHNGNPVPIGAYVYILQLGDGGDAIKGAVNVIR